MAKLEIPSIVVENGSIPPSAMEPAVIRRPQWACNNKNNEEKSTSDSYDLDRSKSISRDASRMKREDTTANVRPLPRPQSKSMRLLTRSYAIKESTSPPPDRSLPPLNGQSLNSSMENLAIINNNNSIVVNNNSNGKLENSQETNKMIESQKPSVSASPGNSTDQAIFNLIDQAGVNVEEFIIDTLNKNHKARPIMMMIENELVKLTKDPNRHTVSFGPMSSYQRMFVHKICHYFGLDHNVDTSGQNVVVDKTKITRLPEKRFSELIKDDFQPSEEPRRSILKRDSASFEETTTFKGYSQPSQAIGNSYPVPQGWESRDWSLPKSDDLSKLHPDSNRSSRLKKVESYESNDTLKANSLRSSISKSYSFGGYDQNSQNNNVLTKQDSGSSMNSRVNPSPLSSGYKSQSLHSVTLSATPSPSATPHLPRQFSSQGPKSPEAEEVLVWVATNLDAVPVGSVLIDPQSGEPITNDDGSVYRYDPAKPPNLNGLMMASGSRPDYNNGSGTDKSSEAQERDGNGRIDETPQEATIPRTKDMLVNFAMKQAEINTQHQDYQNHSQPELQDYQIHSQPEQHSNFQNISQLLEHHLSFQNLSQPAQHSNVMPTVAPPAPNFAQGSSQMISQQEALYNLIMGVAPQYTQDLSGYMMGMRLGETKRMNPSQHQMCYCNPAHTTVQPAAIPIPQNTVGMPTQTMIGPPAQFQPLAQLPPYVYKYALNLPPSERSGVDSTYSQQPSTPMNNFSLFPPNPQISAPSLYGSTTNGMAPSVNMGSMQMPSAPTPIQRAPTPIPPAPAPIAPAPAPQLYNTSMSTSTITRENGYAQFPVFTSNYTAPMQSCFPHYQVANVPLTPVLRPALPFVPPTRISPYVGPIRSLQQYDQRMALNGVNHINPQTGPRHMNQSGNPDPKQLQ